MVTVVDYNIRENKRIYPIRCETECLNIDPLLNLIEGLNEYIAVVKRANVLIEHAEGSRLFEIMRAINEEICYGHDEFDAIIMVSHKYKLPLNMVFLAYSLEEEYHHSYERYIMANVIKILFDMGLKPMQIYKKVNALPDTPTYSYRTILETLKAWNDKQYVTLRFFKKECNVD